MTARRAAAVLAVVIGLLACVVPRADAAPAGRPAVILIGVPGLEWSDLPNMPALERFSAAGSVGELVVKTSGGVTRCGAGILAVGAGNRTGSFTPSCEIYQASWSYLSAGNGRSKYRATIGVLGSLLEQHGIKRYAVGDDAAALLSDEQGNYATVIPDVATAPPSGDVVALMDNRLYAVPDQSRPAAARAVDARLAHVLTAVPANATVIIAGMSDLSGGKGRLHFVAIRGPGWRHTEMRSSAAGRAPYVQLIDIAPTILTLEGIEAPSTIVGRPMQQSNSAVRSVASYVSDNRHAIAERTLGQRVFLVFGIAVITMMILGAIRVGPARLVARVIARLLAPAPMLAFAVNALPWWDWGQTAYELILLGACCVVAGLTTIAARRGKREAIIVPMLASYVALIADQLTGGSLQLSAPLGNNPIVAGRFTGVGNYYFAVLATSALLLAAMLAGPYARRKAGIIAGVVALIAVVIDGAPQIGDDFGGVFALVPAAVVVVALVLRARITVKRVVLVVVGTLAVAVLIALADYSRPATSQSHVGRFVGQVLHGGAATEVDRKLHAALSTFGLTVGTFVVVTAVVLAVLVHRRLGAALRTVPGLTAGAVAATVAAVLGVALNDSGIPIAAVATVVGVSAVYGAGVRSEPVVDALPD